MDPQIIREIHGANHAAETLVFYEQQSFPTIFNQGIVSCLVEDGESLKWFGAESSQSLTSIVLLYNSERPQSMSS